MSSSSFKWVCITTLKILKTTSFYYEKDYFIIYKNFLSIKIYPISLGIFSKISNPARKWSRDIFINSVKSAINPYQVQHISKIPITAILVQICFIDKLESIKTEFYSILSIFFLLQLLKLMIWFDFAKVLSRD